MRGREWSFPAGVRSANNFYVPWAELLALVSIGERAADCLFFANSPGECEPRYLVLPPSVLFVEFPVSLRVLFDG